MKARAETAGDQGVSLCYLCERPTDDWQEPCVCGSRAFYQGKPLKGRMPDFGEVLAPAMLLGEMPKPTVLEAFFRPESWQVNPILGAKAGRRAPQTYRRTVGPKA